MAGPCVVPLSGNSVVDDDTIETPALDLPIRHQTSIDCDSDAWSESRNDNEKHDLHESNGFHFNPAAV